MSYEDVEDVKVTCMECGRVLTVFEDESHQPWRCGVCAGMPYAFPASLERHPRPNASGWSG